MKKEPDEIDFEILKNAVRLCTKNKGVRLREVYRPLLQERCDSFLWKRVMILTEESFLKIDRSSPGKVFVTPSAKARKIVEHNNGPKKGEPSCRP